MICTLTGLLATMAKRRLLDFALNVGVALLVASFGIASLGFCTFAAYVYLSASEGRAAAALNIGTVYGLSSVVILTMGLTRRRAGRLPRATALPAPASTGAIDSLLLALTASDAPPDQTALSSALRLGRELSPMQLLALALIGGFIAGRKIGK